MTVGICCSFNRLRSGVLGNNGPDASVTGALRRPPAPWLSAVKVLHCGALFLELLLLIPVLVVVKAAARAGQGRAGQGSTAADSFAEFFPVNV